MKKNLLFVLPSLSAGGGEKSLVNLLTQIDYNLYNVDLFLLNHEGLFTEYLPRQVEILPMSKNYEMFRLPLLQAIIRFLNKGKLLHAYHRLMFSMLNRLISDISKREQKSWKYITPSIDKIEKEYDVAIGFLEKTSTYICVEKSKADRKVGWVHIDYDKLGMDPEFDIHYFQQLDHIVTVSEECANVLKRRFPTEEKKVQVIYNIVSPTLIHTMAKEEKEVNKNYSNKEIKILSIGRLHYQKGFEFAIEACRKLLDKGYRIQWDIIGEGEERNKLTSLIKKYKLEGHFNLIGLKANPYPYIQNADIYAQTSRFEGKSIAIDEAKILKKPIVVTNYSTARDQIKDEENGLIVDMNSNAIVEGIERLIKDEVLKERLVKNLSKEKLGTEEEIAKVYALIGENS